ncbi:hypothetical protein [Paenibacillus sp. 32O-W]|nr:hypothetical protein [Paenibacillus sp. 32O-W]
MAGGWPLKAKTVLKVDDVVIPIRADRLPNGRGEALRQGRA